MWRDLGIFVLDKPCGWPSSKVVAVARRVLGIKRVGHVGTLDPLAAGVLPIAVLSATRLSDLIHLGEKCYLATLRFGYTSSTDDAEGEIEEQGPVVVDESEIRSTLRRFVGIIEQVPPAFSAVKISGRPAYRLARQNKSVVLDPRPVRIDSIDLIAWRSPSLTIRVRCGKGTYIRALSRDIGRSLGCGAYLESLVRESVGGFILPNAIQVERFVAMSYEELRQALIPPELALPDHDRVILEMPAETAFRNGIAVAGRVEVRASSTAGSEGANESETVASLCMASDGRTIGLTRPSADGFWTPVAVFPETAVEKSNDTKSSVSRRV